ncbi:Ldh family oxidoreductase [Litorisediminicola beolgyonensis]|uniref:Ldh family oxidoreductase n=1 Tax=Litorisediminicola beolgyonensis TaxID=1173614 RepID=A0ABW3ZL49_9RHOB
MRLSLGEAERLLAAAFAGAGVPGAVAASVARALVAADAEGQSGHGFSRVADYVAQVRSGKVRAGAGIAVTRSATTVATVDAGYGFAYPALDRATALAAEIAQEHGSAVVAVARSHHCGALSVQVDRIARAGCLGIMVANAPAAIAPWGAKTPLYGTNPIAFAAPRPDGSTFVADLSLSRVARGKVMNARKTGQPIPADWALDRDGAPTTDPEAALAGSMLPIGGAKGTVLALMVEILAAVLPGASLSREASSFFDAEGPPPGTGQTLIAIRPPDPAAFGARLERLFALLLAEEGARLPGARRDATRAEAERDGLVLSEPYLTQIRRLAGVGD